MSDPVYEPPVESTRPRTGFGAGIARLTRGKPTQPGETYGVPGSGDTLVLSLFTIAILIFVWWLITELELVKPLFVPSPQSIVQKFISVWQNGFTGTPLWEHIAISAARVFGAFLLACAIGVPRSGWPWA